MASGKIRPLMGAPDYANAIDVPELWEKNGSYTVPGNGYLHFEILMNGSGNYSCEAVVGNKHYRNFVRFQADASGNSMSLTIPVEGNMVITCTEKSNIIDQPSGTVNFNYYPKFIPCK